ILISAENETALYGGLAIRDHLLLNALDLLRDAETARSVRGGGGPLAGQAQRAVHQLDGGAEGIVGGVGVGGGEREAGLHLGVVLQVGPQLQQRADLVGRVRCDVDLQAGGDLAVGLGDAPLDAIHISDKQRGFGIEVGNHGGSQEVTMSMLMVSCDNWSRMVISFELAS